MKNIFGTDGIRATINTPPFTQEGLTQLAHAIGQWCNSKYTTPLLLIGQDTRASCDWIKQLIAPILLGYGIDILDANILPTPALFHIMKQKAQVSCALMISASHNPYTDNGLKLIDSQTGKISPQDESRITQLFYQVEQQQKQSHQGTYNLLSDGLEIYANSVLACTNGTSGSLRIVLDTSNGATYTCAQKIFKKAGIETSVIHNNPNGTNINENCGALHPESLIKTVIEQKADCGFAFDGDGDRVIAVNRQGIIIDGDGLLALMVMHPDYQQEKILVATTMSNQGLARYCSQRDINLIRTDVGDKYVLEGMRTHDAHIGGEQSGHIIIRNCIPTGDGILVALKILESMVYNQNWNLDTFTKFPQLLLNVPIKQKKDLKVSPYKEIIAKAEEQLPHGRLIVRYSGTELILRIMVEDENYEHAQTIAHNLAHELGIIDSELRK